jgi:heme/copper-type cytochrome/quinol oxidase subunit 3
MKKLSSKMSRFFCFCDFHSAHIKLALIERLQMVRIVWQQPTKKWKKMETEN